MPTALKILVMTAICDYGDHGNAAIDDNGDDGDAVDNIRSCDDGDFSTCSSQNIGHDKNGDDENAVDNNGSCDIGHYCASLKILVTRSLGAPPGPDF